MAVLQPTVFKSGLNTIFMGLVVVAGSIAAWCYWGHHFRTALHGPTQITLADIARLEDPRQLPSTWVKVKFDKAVESEVVLEATRAGSSRIEEKYFIFQAGDRWVLACVPETFQGRHSKGKNSRARSGSAGTGSPARPYRRSPTNCSTCIRANSPRSSSTRLSRMTPNGK
jgi:hypothetical protein